MPQFHPERLDGAPKNRNPETRPSESWNVFRALPLKVAEPPEVAKDQARGPVR